MAKANKKAVPDRPKKYGERLSVKGGFIDIVKAAAKNANAKSKKA
jgi:hypothetical protein